MLIVNRSIDFWTSIVEDPFVNSSLGMTTQEFINCVTHPKVTPFASENGGFLVIDLSVGLVAEFHAAFNKAGRGKEVHSAFQEFLEHIFINHDMLITYETDNPNSRPPLSFGFKGSQNGVDTDKGILKLWYLTKSQWTSSPAYRRMIK